MMIEHMILVLFNIVLIFFITNCQDEGSLLNSTGYGQMVVLANLNWYGHSFGSLLHKKNDILHTWIFFEIGHGKG